VTMRQLKKLQGRQTQPNEELEPSTHYTRTQRARENKRNTKKEFHCIL